MQLIMLKRTIVENVFVKVHQFVGLIKWYYGLLRRIYIIISKEIPSINYKLGLEMLVKA